MRADIKERIEQIAEGTIPEGYQTSKLGIAPVEWEKIEFRDLFEEKKERTSNTREYPLYSLTLEDGIVEKSERYDREHLVKKEDSAYKVVQPNEFAYNPMNIRLGAVARNKSGKTVCVSGYYDVFKTKNSKDEEFMEYFLVGNQMIHYYNKVCTGSLEEKKRVHFSDFMQFELALPTAKEREYISKVLMTCDRKIELVRCQIQESIYIKKWTMQNFLVGKRRLNGFESKWEKVKIGEFIQEIDDRTKTTDEYDIMSVTKNGICLQKEHFNKQIASKDNTGYKIVHKGNLVFSTMNLWMGSLDVLDKYEKGIVSPAYKVFDFVSEKMTSEFGKYFMKSETMIWKYNINSEQGASVVRRNLDINSLLANSVHIPGIEEQKELVEIFQMVDKELALLNKKLELLKQEKKALMQLLLSGIVRVNEI